MFPIGDGRRVFADVLTLAKRLDAHDIHRLIKESFKHPDGIASSTDASADNIREFTRHFDELFLGFAPDDFLEVAHHQWVWMGSNSRTKTIKSSLIFFRIRIKSGIHRLLKRPAALFDNDDIGAEDFDTIDVWGLLDDIDFAHIDIALKPKIRSRHGNGRAMAARPGFGNEFLLT